MTSPTSTEELKLGVAGINTTYWLAIMVMVKQWEIYISHILDFDLFPRLWLDGTSINHWYCQGPVPALGEKGQESGKSDREVGWMLNTLHTSAAYISPRAAYIINKPYAAAQCGKYSGVCTFLGRKSNTLHVSHV